MNVMSGQEAVGAPTRTAIPLHPSVYIAAIVAAEGLLAFVETVLGLAVHAVIILGLLTHYSLHSGRGIDPRIRALPAIGLVSLMRILSATMPVRGVDPVYWPALTAIPLTLAMLLVARPRVEGRRGIGLTVPSWSKQALIGGSGAGLGLVGFFVAPSEVFFVQHRLEAWIPLTALIVSVSFLEEVLFRGLIRQRLDQVGLTYSLMATSALFAACYLGSGGSSHLTFIVATGLYFGWCVQRTGSVVGVGLAHASMKLGTFLIWPLLLA